MIKKSVRKKLILPILLCLAVLVLIGVRVTYKHFSASENRTPIPPGPDLENQVTEPTDHSKIQTYEKEIEEQRNAAFREEPDLQTVSIPWNKVFEKDQILSMEVKDTSQRVKPQEFANNKPMEVQGNPKAVKNKQKASDIQPPAPGFNTYKSENAPEVNEKINTNNNLIAAVVHGDQRVSNYQTVAFRVIKQIEIGNIRIPRNTMIYGKAQIGGNRLTIRSERLKTPKGITSMPLKVLDKDLMEGLLIQDNRSTSEIETIGGEILDEVAVYEYTGIVSSLRSVLSKKNDRSLWLMDGYQVYFSYSVK